MLHWANKIKRKYIQKTRQYFIGYMVVLLSQVYNSLPSLILVESKRTLDTVKWSPLFAAKCQGRSLSSSSSYRFQSVNHVTLWNVNATGKRFEGGRPRRAIPAKKETEKMDFVFRLSVDIDQLSGFWLSLSLSDMFYCVGLRCYSARFRPLNDFLPIVLDGVTSQ